jgi:hypothetical protein
MYHKYTLDIQVSVNPRSTAIIRPWPRNNLNILLLLTPDLELALWLALGTFACRLYRKIIVARIAQRDLSAVLVTELEYDCLRTCFKLVRHALSKLGKGQLWVKRHATHVPVKVDLHPDLRQLVHLIPLARAVAFLIIVIRAWRDSAPCDTSPERP